MDILLCIVGAAITLVGVFTSDIEEVTLGTIMLVGGITINEVRRIKK